MRKGYFSLENVQAAIAKKEVLIWPRIYDELPLLGISGLSEVLVIVSKLKLNNFYDTKMPAECGAEALDIYKINYAKQTIYIKFYLDESDRLIIISFHKDRP